MGPDAYCANKWLVLVSYVLISGLHCIIRFIGVAMKGHTRLDLPYLVIDWSLSLCKIDKKDLWH